MAGQAVGNQARSVIVSPQTGMILVRAFPSELAQVEAFIEASQEALQRQVILEAKILEVELKEGFQSGINLSASVRVRQSRDQHELRATGFSDRWYWRAFKR